MKNLRITPLDLFALHFDGGGLALLWLRRQSPGMTPEGAVSKT
jgi:hypothetical protein